jgi:hypothetical protein
MKRILLAIMLFISALGFAQSEKEIVQKYIIDKIKGYKPTDLVPYSKDGEKWALMDVKFRKILTDFVMRIPSTFNPEFMADINIGKWNYGMMINTNYDILPLVIACSIPEWFDVKETDELGFQVDEQGRMTAYNKDYEYISNPILYKGEYYIIIIKKDKTNVLINQKGVEQEGFRFREMDDTYYKDKESGETIFYVEGFDGKKGLVTMSGKKKLYGELLQEVYSGVLGYSVQKDGENTNEIKKSGVVDITTQEWLIKPQERYKIYGIRYASSERIMEDNVENRHKATVYFLATDQSGQHFVLDIKGKPILPKK